MANQTQILNVSDEMKFDDNVQTDNVKEQEENMYSSSSDTTEELCSFRATDTCGECLLTIESKGRSVKRINIKKELFHEYTHKEINIISYVFGDRYHPAVFHRTGTTDWEYAAPNAFSGVFMRNDLWSAVWFGDWIYSADFPIFFIRDADDVSNGDCHGF